MGSLTLPDGLCLLLAAAPEAPLMAWLRRTEKDTCQTKVVPPPYWQTSMQLESIFVLYGC